MLSTLQNYEVQNVIKLKVVSFDENMKNVFIILKTNSVRNTYLYNNLYK